MDTSFFGIGLPELIFIAIIALIVLGPERLPATMREIAKMWGYVRNLSRELTSQFGDEFKVLEEMNPQKLVREMMEQAEKEAREQMDSLKSISTTKSTTTVTTAVTPAGTTQTVKTTEVTVSATPSEVAALPEKPVETTPTTVDSTAIPIQEPKDEPENRILPPTAEAPAADGTGEPPVEALVIEPHLVQSVTTVNLNGTADKAESNL